MIRISPCRVAVAAGMLFATLLTLPIARAQVSPSGGVDTPARNANIYNGRAHQPDAGVQGGEAAAGVAAPEQRAAQQRRDLDRMGHELTDKANQDAASAPPPLRPPNGK